MVRIAIFDWNNVLIKPLNSILKLIAIGLAVGVLVFAVFVFFTVTAELSKLGNSALTPRMGSAPTSNEFTIPSLHCDKPLDPNDETIYPADWPTAIIYEKYKNAVVSVQSYDSAAEVGKSDLYAQGTGYFFQSGNLVVTDLHCLDSKNVGVQTADGHFFKATVVGEDKTRDLAFLRVNAPVSSHQPLPLASSSMPSAADGPALCFFGFPKRNKNLFMSCGTFVETFRQGHNSVKGTTSASFRPGDTAYELYARVERGFSGAPVFNGRGLVIGIVESGEDNTTLVRPIEQILDSAAMLKLK